MTGFDAWMLGLILITMALSVTWDALDARRDRRMNAVCAGRGPAGSRGQAAREQGGGGGGSIGEPGPIAAVGEKVHTRKDTLQKIPKKLPG